jgi:hypothetical protein
MTSQANIQNRHVTSVVREEIYRWRERRMDRESGWERQAAPRVRDMDTFIFHIVFKL